MAAEAGKSRDSGLPKRLGDYEAFLQIGAGGMARVFLASRRGSTSERELVVLKQLRRDIVEDEHALGMFVQEARIAMQLHHPNVGRVRDVIASPPDHAMVMDFLDGQSLLQVLERMKRERMPTDAHLWILSKVVAGLAHAHELVDAAGRPVRVVHRDVSPSNVVVCYDGQVKLVDFGIAKATGAVSATHEGVVRGKLGYASPEQCLGKPADARSDLYSVGVMLWEAVAGRRRAAGETRHSLLQARTQDTEPPLEVVAPEAPLELHAIVGRALSYEPEGRYSSARELAADLDGYLERLSPRMDARRIAALLAPHFEHERVELRRIVDAHFASRGGRTPSGTRPRIPVRVTPKPFEAPPVAPFGGDEEDTSKVPVDDLLLLKSRRESVSPPARSTPPPAATSTETPLVTPAVPEVSGEPVVGRLESAPVVAVTRMPVPVETFEPRRARGRPSGPILAVIGLAALGAAAFVALRVGPGTQPARVLPAAVPASVAAAPTTETLVAPGTNEIRARIAVDPPQATLLLDGRMLDGNPFVGIFAKDGALHELTAGAPGYVRQTRKLPFDGNVDVELVLAPSAAAAGHAHPRATHAAPAPAPVRPVESRASVGPVGPVEPGMDLPGPSGRSKHTIDEKDPYSP